MSALTIEHRPTTTPVSAEERATMMAEPGFGRIFTDHMVTARYTPEHGWHDARLEPYGPLSMDPSTCVLHYGQAIFEGIKAYWQEPDGGVATFRPTANAARFQTSAARLQMPLLPEELFLSSLEHLVETDRAWVPPVYGRSLYLRPFMIATDPFLGVRPSLSYLFLLIASPVAAIFARGVEPVAVWLSTEYVRAAPGGTGAAKCAGNYAGSLLAQAQAAEQGCDQVVWLDATERRYIEEMGGMNMFFVLRDGEETTLVTPELTGTLLPGVTRDSVLAFGLDLGMKVEERRIDVEEWRDGCATGRITETFACGTAAVITPIGDVRSAAGDWTVADGRPGPVTLRLRESLLDLQHGRVADPHGWMHRIGG